MKTQQQFLRDCAKRTPIHKPDSPVLEAFAAVLFFAVAVLFNFI